MPQAVPAINIAAGQAVAAGAITTGILTAFAVNVSLSGFEFRDENGQRWAVLKKDGPRDIPPPV